MGRRTPLTTDEIKARCEKIGLTYVDHYIENKQTYVDVLCKCGKPINIQLRDITNYVKNNKIRTCKECGKVRNNASKFISTEEIVSRCEKVELTYVSHYYDSKKTKTYVECLCKCGDTLKADLNDILQFGKKGKIYSCNKCGRKRTSEKSKGKPRYYCRGENHPNYNPNLTDEERSDRRSNLQYREWQQKVKEKAKFTCDICGDNRGGNLESHHLDGHNWCKDKRYDINNGVCLCDKCHKEFHVDFMHGYINPCTKQDYLDFKQMKQNENNVNE